jgi:hypothetical protein
MVVIGEIIWSRRRKYIFLNISHRFRITTLFRWCRLYYCDCKILQNGSNSLYHNVSDEFLMYNEMQKEILPFIQFFDLHFKVATPF